MNPQKNIYFHKAWVRYFFFRPITFFFSFSLPRIHSFCSNFSKNLLYVLSIWKPITTTVGANRGLIKVCLCTYIEIFSPKKTGFPPRKNYFPNYFWLFLTFTLWNFLVGMLQYFKQKSCFDHEELKKPTWETKKKSIWLFPLLPWATHAEFMFQNAAYWPTVHKTGP